MLATDPDFAPVSNTQYTYMFEESRLHTRACLATKLILQAGSNGSEKGMIRSQTLITFAESCIDLAFVVKAANSEVLSAAAFQSFDS